jgi:hypothetical protein
MEVSRMFLNMRPVNVATISLFSQAVAYTANRSKLRARLSQLLPQGLNMHVNGPGAFSVSVAPDPFEQLTSRKHALRMLHQSLEKGKLLGGEFNFGALGTHAMPLGLQRKRSAGKNARHLTFAFTTPPLVSAGGHA